MKPRRHGRSVSFVGRAGALLALAAALLAGCDRPAASSQPRSPDDTAASEAASGAPPPAATPADPMSGMPSPHRHDQRQTPAD